MPMTLCSRGPIVAALLVLAVGIDLLAQTGPVRGNSIDPGIFARIRNEGTSRSRIMTYATELIDGIGPRLTGSPNLDKAIGWARKTLVNAGCTNVRAESWGAFGLGWQERNVWMRLTHPDMAPMVARAAPWSPATQNGMVSGELVAVRGFSSDKDFESYRGKLRGKIVLYGTAPSTPEVFPIEKPLFERLSNAQLEEFAAHPYQRPTGHDDRAANARLHFDQMEKAGKFFASENVAAVVVPSGNNTKGGASGGTIYVDTNYTFGWFVYKREHAMQVPLVILAIEHYGRLSRLLQRGVGVRVELNVDTAFSVGDQEAFNVFADIPRVDPERNDEIVLVTAHLDGWSAGTGATDDGAGVIIAMQARRILRAVGVAPRRTIRLALWTGEEQGSLGSREYVKRHVATVPLSQEQRESGLPDFMRSLAGPVLPKPEHSRISAVYTLDAGGGRIRGVSTGNPMLVPIFRQWLAPLGDLGVTMVAERSDCGGDCWTFEQVGIPTPSFKQDPLDYESRSHHTNMDTYEHLLSEDLKQAAVVVATVLYATAIHDQMLPRIPLNR